MLPTRSLKGLNFSKNSQIVFPRIILYLFLVQAISSAVGVTISLTFTFERPVEVQWWKILFFFVHGQTLSWLLLHGHLYFYYWIPFREL